MRFKYFLLAIISLFCGDCLSQNISTVGNGVRLVILGTIQDAGSPHIACRKECCRNIFLRPVTDRKVVSIGILDDSKKQS